MALAPFFKKASLAMSSLFGGMNADEVRSLLDGKCIAIACDEASVSTHAGRWILELSTNLAARLYPGLAIIAEGTSAEAFAAELRAMALRINPLIEFFEIDDANALISVGAKDWSQLAIPVVYAGAEEWLAHVSFRLPRPLGTEENPFGAGAAACLASAQLFRRIFSEHFSSPSEEEVSLSLWNYAVNEIVTSAVIAPCAFESVVLCGAGAIGNAAVWALLRAPVSGELMLVDHEDLEESNLQRYVLAETESVGQAKVHMLEALSPDSLLKIVPIQSTWATFISDKHPAVFDLVATALDTANDRIEVQGALPREIVNAWTQSGDLGVSRHGFLGERACLACLYLSEHKQKNEDEIVAAALGLDASPHSPMLMSVRNALYSNTPLNEDWLTTLAASMKVDREKLTPFLGHPLRDLYQGGICGGQLVTTQKGSVQVPMAFQSAMAGIMLGAEMVKNRLGYESDLVTTRLNLLRPLGIYLSESEEKSRFGNCVCQDEDFIAMYRAKFCA